MQTFVPIFSSIVDSSLWGEEDWVVKIFMTMLAKQDADFVVRANAYTIGQWARKDEATAIKALKILSSPDKNRVEPQPFDGRRVQKVEDGWQILNGQKYQDMMLELKYVRRRVKQAIWQKEKRRKEREEREAKETANMPQQPPEAPPGKGSTKGLTAREIIIQRVAKDPITVLDRKTLDGDAFWKEKMAAADARVATEGQGHQIPEDDYCPVIDGPRETPLEKELRGGEPKTFGDTAGTYADKSGTYQTPVTESQTAPETAAL